MLKIDYKKAKLNPDKPLELISDDDKLSFNKIVESVIDLIKLPQRPFTFGLFGRWGTGKSTILGELEKRLDGKEYYVVTFDAWKYEGDALRRSFLLSIADQLNAKTKPRTLLPDEKVLSDDFVKVLRGNAYQDRSEPQLRPNFKLKNLGLFVVAFIIFLGAEVMLSLNLPETSKFLRVSPLILAFFMGVAAFVINAISPSSIGKLLIKEINIGTDKLSSPEEFYSEFLNILKEIEGKTLLVIIDNLDRTQKDVTVKLLGTIKTFLNSDRSKEDVIFLVASDHKAIKRHIKEVYATNKEDAYEAEEFIKKFFNAVIEIPPFISSEYRAYLIDLLNESGIKMLTKHRENMISIISTGYPDNPRGAKHFVNSLVVYLVMLSSMGDGAGIEQDFIEKNLNFIATLLVIRDRFDEVYDDIQEQSLKYEHPWEEIKEKIVSAYSSDDAPKGKRRDFEIFYNSIESWVSPDGDSLKWFFNMRRSVEEQKLPNWDAFVSSVDKKDQEQAVKYLAEFFEQQPDTLNALLEQHIRNVKNETSRWTSFSSVFIAFITRNDQASVELLKGSIKETFRFFPSTQEFTKFTNQINCGRLLELLKSDFIDPAERTRVRTAVNGYLRSDNVSVQPLVEIVDAENNSEPPNTTTVKAIGEYLDSEENDYKDNQVILDALADLENKQEFISWTATDKVLQSVTEAGLQEDDLLAAKLNFVQTTRYTTKIVADKYVELITWLHRGGNQNNRTKYSIFFYDYLTMQDDVLKVVELQNIQVVTQYLIAWYQEIPNNYSLNRSYIPLIALFSQIDSNGYAANSKTIVQEFLGGASFEDIAYIMSKLELNDDNKQLVTPKINERILHDTQLFTQLGGQESEWFSNDDLINLSTYLVSNASSLDNEVKFTEAINLSKQLINYANGDIPAYEQKLYDTLLASVDSMHVAVSSYVQKRNDNILASHSDWLLDLKRKLRKAKDE